jgi:hypothetical protein
MVENDFFKYFLLILIDLEPKSLFATAILQSGRIQPPCENVLVTLGV